VVFEARAAAGAGVGEDGVDFGGVETGDELLRSMFWRGCGRGCGCGCNPGAGIECGCGGGGGGGGAGAPT